MSGIGVQIWHQVLLFFATTTACALILQATARLTGDEVRFGVAFGRISFAMTTPFGFIVYALPIGLFIR